MTIEEEVDYMVNNILEYDVSEEDMQSEIEYNWVVRKWYEGFTEDETEDKLKFDKLCKKFNIWNLYNNGSK